jgi:hypothetical protein
MVIDDVEHGDTEVRAALRALKTDLAAARTLVIAVGENQQPSSAREADLSLALGPLDVKRFARSPFSTFQMQTRRPSPPSVSSRRAMASPAALMRSRATGLVTWRRAS